MYITSQSLALSKGNATAVKGQCHCSQREMPVQSKGHTTVVKRQCHCSERAMPVQSKESLLYLHAVNHLAADV